MDTTTPMQLSAVEERTVHALQILGDKTRFKIFKLMQTGDDLCVSQIAESIGVSTSAISQHFRDFEHVGLVDKKRQGQRICYTLKDDELVNALKVLTATNKEVL